MVVDVGLDVVVLFDVVGRFDDVVVEVVGCEVDAVVASSGVTLSTGSSAGFGDSAPPMKSSTTAIGVAIFQVRNRQTIAAPANAKASPIRTPPKPLPAGIDAIAPIAPKASSTQPMTVTMRFFGAGTAVGAGSYGAGED
ncbi:hypothetical protein ACH46_13610 [Gordonia phthalatica]|uniref:Uncharacterized protein n=1 Tax=Gordonia phthalatica TaxID=1136941 RepID=A0A0N9NDZ9_9ACTN|nr:hypothetical protein ACH46_13610 [Gordonia phthalatica]